MRSTQISFSAGEISPEMQGRIDARQYQYGLAKCSNFIIRPQGVADRRVGMRRAGSTYSSTQTRLIPFVFSDQEAYALELGDGRGRIWNNGNLVQWAAPAGESVGSIDTGASPNTLTTVGRHGLDTGDTVQFIGSNMLGLTAGTSYTVTVVDARTFSIATSLTGTLSGTLRCFKTEDMPPDYQGTGTNIATSTTSPTIDTTAAHGISEGQRVRLQASGSLPSGLSSSVTYYARNVTATSLQLSYERNGDIETWTGAWPSSPTLKVYRRYLEGETVFWDGSSGLAHGVYRATQDFTASNAAVITGFWELLPTDGTYTFDIPYGDDDLRAVHYTQSNDVMTLVHPDYAPLELARYGLAHWSTQSIAFSSNLESPANLSSTVDRGDKFVISFEEQGPGLGGGAFIAQFHLEDRSEVTPNGTQTNPTGIHLGIDTGDTVYIEFVQTLSLPGQSGSLNFTDSTTDGYYRVDKADTNSAGNPRLQLRPVGGTVLTTDSTNRYPLLNGWVSPAGAEDTHTYVVTALDDLGTESAPSAEVEVDNVLEALGASTTLSWDEVVGAVRYRVYRSLSGLFGLIGETDELTFKDDDKPIDMSQTPPIVDDSLDGRYGYPRAVAYFEQRRCFAGTDDKPRNLYMTRSGTESDLSYSLPIKDTDRISVTLAAREATTIRHIVPLQDMLLLTQQGEWRVFAINSDAIGPETIAVRQQSEIGANQVQPLVINNVVVYGAARGGHIRQMSIAQNGQGYLTGDLSLRATHLFDNFTIDDATFQQAPYPIMWWVSSSGKLLACTYIPEEELAAWHQHSSADATFESVCSVPEGQQDTVYAVVVRGTERSIERMVPDIVVSLEDGVYADAAVVRDGYSSAFTRGSSLTFEQGGTYRAGDIVQVTLTEPALASSDAGDHLRVTYDGEHYLMQIQQVTSGTQADVRLSQALPQSVHTATVTSWGLASGSVSGLSHLDGKTVQVVADGAYSGTQTVSGGSVTLSGPAARVVVGLAYDSDLETLPQAYQVQGFGQGTSKNVRDVWMRVVNSGGLQVGPGAGDLVPVETLTSKELSSGEYETAVPSEWTQSGQMLVRQSLPLPATILNLTMLTEVGD